MDLLRSSILWLLTLGTTIRIIMRFYKERTLWKAFLFIRVIRFSVITILLFYLLFEIRLIPILLILIYWGAQPERLSAGLYFLCYTTFFSIPYIAIVLLLLPTTFFSFQKGLIRTLRVFILMSPFLVKIPIFGIHYWLPKAHVEARTSGSIILAGILLKLGSYGIIRVLRLGLRKRLILMSSNWLLLAILASVVTIIQRDVKKLIAYRRVRHITILILGLSLFTKINYLSKVIISLAHGWASMGIFAVAGLLSHSSLTRMRRLLGVENKFHWYLISFGLLLVSNSSVPPFPSFFPELFFISNRRRLAYLSLRFILFRVFVCYYNTFLFLLVGHVKQIECPRGFMTFSYLNTSFYCRWLALVTLIWLYFI